MLNVEQFCRRPARCHLGQRSIFWPTKIWSNTSFKGVESKPHPLLECLISLRESFCRKMLIRWNWNVLLKCLHFNEDLPQAAPPVETCLVCYQSAAQLQDSKIRVSFCWKAWKCSSFSKTKSFTVFGLPANIGFQSCDKLCSTSMLTMLNWEAQGRWTTIFLC